MNLKINSKEALLHVFEVYGIKSFRILEAYKQVLFKIKLENDFETIDEALFFLLEKITDNSHKIILLAACYFSKITSNISDDDPELMKFTENLDSLSIKELEQKMIELQKNLLKKLDE